MHPHPLRPEAGGCGRVLHRLFLVCLFCNDAGFCVVLRDAAMFIWGFDYDFTNYNFKQNNLFQKHIDFHPSGDMRFSIYKFKFFFFLLFFKYENMVKLWPNPHMKRYALLIASLPRIWRSPRLSLWRRAPAQQETRNGVFTEGPQILHILLDLALSAHMLPHFVSHFVTFCHISNILQHFAHIFPQKFVRGNCGISATLVFYRTRPEAAKTPPGSRTSRRGCSSDCYYFLIVPLTQYFNTTTINTNNY